MALSLPSVGKTGIVAKQSPMDKYRDAFKKASRGVGKTGDTTMRNPQPSMTGRRGRRHGRRGSRK